jgi:hypothetical protein
MSEPPVAQTTRRGPPYGPQPPGNWPTMVIMWEGERRRVPFFWSTFDVWPELWDGIERCRMAREARFASRRRAA